MPIRDFVRKVVQNVYSNSPRITMVKSEDIEECLEVCAAALSHVMTAEGVKSYTRGVADWSISVKAEYKGRIVGCYVLNKRSVVSQQHCSDENLERYKSMNGVQGVALAVLPEYRDLGIGKKLREYPLNQGYDYIWGLHMKNLQNINNWVKFGRRVLCDTGHMFTTIMDISPKAIESTSMEKQNLSESDFGQFHSYQKAGHTCGPTCVQMVADFLGAGYGDIEQIIDLCGCNTKTGTIDTGMKKALDSLGINNERNPFREDADEAMAYLDSLVEKGEIFIMRTLTRGVKHWIIVYGKSDGRFLIADPWLGKIRYTEPEILEIWQPRDFDGFKVTK